MSCSTVCKVYDCIHNKTNLRVFVIMYINASISSLLKKVCFIYPSIQSVCPLKALNTLPVADLFIPTPTLVTNQMRTKTIQPHFHGCL